MLSINFFHKRNLKYFFSEITLAYLNDVWGNAKKEEYNFIYKRMSITRKTVLLHQLASWGGGGIVTSLSG
jgi:hypothetical protein